MAISISKGLVKKYFSVNNLSIFYNEIFWLKKFQKYNFVPRIIDIDYHNYIILISYEGEKISDKNKPNDWVNQLKNILYYLRKNNCFHSDIKCDNLLVNKNKLVLIDFAQSIKISDLVKNKFLKKRIFFDEYSVNRINLSINKNQIYSNDLRVLVVWKLKYDSKIQKKLKENKYISVIDKIKIKKNFYYDIFKNKVFWIDQFYNKNINKNTNKLKDDIFVYIIRSINPIFKSNKMIFTKEEKIVDDKIFLFKKNIRKKKLSMIHISDNFEESKRNAVFLSKSKVDYPAIYFSSTQNIFNSKKDFFKKLNKIKKLKYVILRDQLSEKDDIDILVNDYYLFKRISDCHSYKHKNLNFISNSGDPVEENGIKVSNFIKVKNKVIKIDVRFIGDGYLDAKWQKNILQNKVFRLGRYMPNPNDYIYNLMYHIVYHKGFINKKYQNILEKKLHFKNIHFMMIKKEINEYLKINRYKVTRPSDLTIPVPYNLNNKLLNNEIDLIQNQIIKRNFSGVNKMLFNLFKYQKMVIFFKKRIIFLTILNQYNLIKFKLKNLFFRYFSLDDLI
jgi:hypothetical protein